MSDGRVRYARSGGAHIAYRMWGDADITLVLVLGWVSGSIDTFDNPTSPYRPVLDLFLPHTRLVCWVALGSVRPFAAANVSLSTADLR